MRYNLRLVDGGGGAKIDFEKYIDRHHFNECLLVFNRPKKISSTGSASEEGYFGM